MYCRRSDKIQTLTCATVVYCVGKQNEHSSHAMSIFITNGSVWRMHECAEQIFRNCTLLAINVELVVGRLQREIVYVIGSHECTLIYKYQLDMNQLNKI